MEFDPFVINKILVYSLELDVFAYSTWTLVNKALNKAASDWLTACLLDGRQFELRAELLHRPLIKIDISPLCNMTIHPQLPNGFYIGCSWAWECSNSVGFLRQAEFVHDFASIFHKKKKISVSKFLDHFRKRTWPNMYEHNRNVLKSFGISSYSYAKDLLESKIQTAIVNNYQNLRSQRFFYKAFLYVTYQGSRLPYYNTRIRRWYAANRRRFRRGLPALEEGPRKVPPHEFLKSLKKRWHEFSPGYFNHLFEQL